MVKGVSYSDSLMYGGDYKLKILKKYDLLLSADITTSKEIDKEKNKLIQEGSITNWAIQTATNIKQWRFSLRYDNVQTWTKNSEGKFATQTFFFFLKAQAKTDLLFPTGIKIPFIGNIPLKNRLIFDSSAFYNTQSSVINIEADNYQNFGLIFSADYEISKNFRCTVGTNLSRYLYTYVPEQNYSVIELISKLTIQF